MPAAQITYPTGGTTDADVSQPIQWTTVLNAQAYYLYVGTTLGAKDLIDTGEIQPTSYLAAGLPSNQTVFARLWTKVGGTWRFTDSTFMMAVPAAVVATLTYPVNGATNVNLTLPIQWTTVVNAQAYVLYVGSTLGANNLVNTSEMLPTSYLAAGVPGGQTVFARMWTKVGGTWRSTDSSFIAAVPVPVVATLTFPVNGAANIGLTPTFQWTSVNGAQAYVLYVGTSPGAKDLFGTNEIQQTSYQSAGLPSGQMSYARTWAKVGGVWGYTDSTFTTTSGTATLTSPANGATNVGLTPTFQWTTVPGAQAYVLYVGTTTGASNVLNTNEIQLTSYAASGLPGQQVLYARMWAEAGGVWRYTDGTFSTVSSLRATLTSPANGATNVGLTAFQWTSVPAAQAYVLYVGTSTGASDVIDTSEIQQTSYQSASLPTGQTLYARVWTKVGGTWRYTDSTFTAAPVKATLTSPTDGATNVAVTTYQWTGVPNAQAYVLFLGTSVGADDLLRMLETQQTSYTGSSLPGGAAVFARLWTKTGDVWRYNDSSFTVSPTSLSFAPRFIHPTHGASGVDGTRAFEWTRGDGANAYALWIGSSAGMSDLLNTGSMAGTTYLVSDLPSGPTLYASIWSEVEGNWSRHSDIAFTLVTSGFESRIVFPPDGVLGVDGGRPFEWSDSHLAQAYRLTIGTLAGGSDLQDSGEVRVLRRFVDNLPTGIQLFGSVHTKVNGQWFTSDFTFSLASNAVTMAARVDAALWAANFVRTMTPSASNRPYRWTLLWDTVYESYPDARCGNFTEVLLDVLTEMNVGLQTRSTEVRFTQIDVHVLAEVLNGETNEWMLVDPTFDLAARRTDDGGWASAADVAAATVALDWSAIDYVFLGPQNGAYASAYHLDYPLLFLNNFVSGSLWNTALPYLNQIALPASSLGPGLYLVACDQGPTADVVLNGNIEIVACASDGLSSEFPAVSVEAPSGSSPNFRLYQPRRFVF